MTELALGTGLPITNPGTTLGAIKGEGAADVFECPWLKESGCTDFWAVGGSGLELLDAWRESELELVEMDGGAGTSPGGGAVVVEGAGPPVEGPEDVVGEAFAPAAAAAYRIAGRGAGVVLGAGEAEEGPEAARVGVVRRTGRCVVESSVVFRCGTIVATGFTFAPGLFSVVGSGITAFARGVGGSFAGVRGGRGMEGAAVGVGGTEGG